MHRPVWVAALVCLGILPGCAGTTALDDAKQQIDQVLIDEPYPVSEIRSTEGQLYVEQVSDGVTSRWVLLKEPRRFALESEPRVAMEPDAFRESAGYSLLTQIADECDSDSHMARVRVVSPTATVKTMRCGDSSTQTFLNGRETLPFDKDSDAANLEIAWDELREVVPDSPLESIGFYFDASLSATTRATVVSYDVQMPREFNGLATCRWGRDTRSTYSLGHCTYGARDTETFTLNETTPQLLAAAIESAKSDLGIEEEEETLEVTVTSKDSQVLATVRYDGNSGPTAIKVIG